MSDGGKGDKRRPENAANFDNGFSRIFGNKLPERGSFVFDEDLGKFVPKAEFVPKSLAPFVMGDISPYQSMVDGRMITSRSSHREHLRANSLIEIGNETKYLKPKEKKIAAGLKQRIAEIVNAKL